MFHRFHRKPGKLIAFVFALTLGWAVSAASPAAADTTVSLTFQAAIDDQYQARQVLLDHGMRGTFYVNSGRLGLDGRLTWRQVNQLATDGNEIGGQTVNNPFLSGLSPAELQRQICDDRTLLLDKGYSPVSFAYPRGSADATAAAQAQVQACGYASGRGDTGLGGTGQPKGEAIPPQNPYLVRTRGSIDQGDTLAEIKTWITEAQQTGTGWFPIVFSSVCDPAQDLTCPTSHITPADFDGLLDWLQGQEANGINVKTVRKVMTGTDQPVPPPLQTTVSLTFDDGWANQMAATPMLAEHDMDATFFLITDRVGNSGYLNWADVASLYADGNEIGGHTTNHQSLTSLPPDQARAAVCDARQALLARGYPQLSFAYPRGHNDAATEGLVQECGYLSGRDVTPTAEWGTAVAETIPPLNRWAVRTPGTIDATDTLPEIQEWITDAEELGEAGNVWVPLAFHHICDPNVTNCADPNGVDGQYITPSDLDSLLDFLEARASFGTRVRTVGQVMTEPEHPPVDKAAPATEIRCNGASCQGTYGAPVSISLQAADTGGSGLKEIRYTTDGSLPTGSSPVYTGPFTLSGTADVRFRATDNAGNAESVQIKHVALGGDTTPPSSSALCDGAACSSGFYNHAVSLTLSATDTGASGVKNIRYTTNGSTPTGSSPVYSGPINVGSTATVKWRAEDNAGNIEAIRSQMISIDTVKPTTTIRCNGAICSSSGFYNQAVSVTLSATDTGGSGLKNIRYTTNGSTPTTSSPLYTGPIQVGSTTTIRFRAYDNAGNVESTKSQTVKVRRR